MFVVLTRGRTGSSALCDFLDRQIDITCFNELLTNKCHSNLDGFGHAGKGYGHNGACLSYSHSLGNPADWIVRLEEIKSQTSVSRVGLKILYHHIQDFPELATMLLSRARVILLTRSPFTQAISGLVANTTGIWNSTQGNVKDHLPVYISPELVRKEMEYIAAWDSHVRTLVRSMGGKFLEFDYDSLFQGPNTDVVLEELRGFLEVLPFPDVIETTHFQRLLPSYELAISNWSEFRDFDGWVQA